MSDESDIARRLLEELTPFLGRGPGTHAAETPISRMKVWTSTQATTPTPALFEPMFYAVLRGKKVLTLGNNRFELSAGECAATSFGLPFVGHFEDATRAAPYAAICLNLDVDLLLEVIRDMPQAEDRWVCSATVGQLKGMVGEAFIRFIRLLGSGDDRAVLARPYERELYYRLLQTPMGDTLRQLGQRNNRSQRIKAAADWLHANVSKTVVISELASSSGMSLTSFHRHFKAVTGYSPLAFQRQMRLMQARQLLTTGSLSVTRVAYSVGYLSPSQFSREYKAMFGIPPAVDLAGPGKRSAG